MRLFLVKKISQFLPHNKIQLDLNNKLILSSLPYYLLTIITLSGYFSMQSHAFIFIFIIYSVLPILDEIITIDWRNPSEEERRKLQDNNIMFQLALYCSVVSDWILFFKVMQIFTNYQLTMFNLINLLGLLSIFSNLNSVQFAIAHEIFHKQNFFDRLLGT